MWAVCILLGGCPEIPYASRARNVGDEISALTDMSGRVSGIIHRVLLIHGTGLCIRRHGFQYSNFWNEGIALLVDEQRVQITSVLLSAETWK